jgi:chitin synthase
MYYLLSYKLLGKKDRDFGRKYSLFHNFSGFGDLMKNISEDKKLIAQNTFILALDGDVDFKPEAVLLLVDRMRKNPKVGAACGRIHPIGSGPMVWYQKFEYAVGHWLQKAAEHKLGCVLCSPGCFSLFRGSALMDDNVMRRYADKATEASHYVQYDQGEDRWLCTLLLQEGYRVDYCAASDALTYAPETFKEFFNQRRRWMPSTIANILDLLRDARHTILVNENISFFYIIYQGFLLASTILGPGTILLTVASSFRTVFTSLTLAESYTLAVAPAVFYLIICLKTKPETQVFIGALMSSIYAMIMTMVLVATIAQFTSSDEISASSFFFVFLIILFFVTGCLHPQEILNLIYGLLYLVTLPGGYVLLVIYSICNLHIVSWGTREVEVKKKPATSKKSQSHKEQHREHQLKENQQTKNAKTGKDNKAKKKSLMSYFVGGGDGGNQDNGVIENATKFIQNLMKPNTSKQEQLLMEIRSKLEGLNEQGAKKEKVVASNIISDETPKHAFFGQNANMLESTLNLNKSAEKKENETTDTNTTSSDLTLPGYDSQIDIPRNYLYNPYWIEMKAFGKNDVFYLNTKEITFWQGLIDKYLYPLNKDELEEKRITRDLKELRNNSCFAFFMLNALWVVMQFQFEYVSITFPKLQIPIGAIYNRPDQKVQILGLIFLILFTLVLLLQFLSMLFHRWGTIIEILASTRLFSKHHKYRKSKLTIQEAVDLIKEMELETHGREPYIDHGSNSPSNNVSNEDSSFVEPDPDYVQGEDEDILPEPEPDYFDHPAVNNAVNWNRYYRLMSPTSAAMAGQINNLNGPTQSFLNAHQMNHLHYINHNNNISPYPNHLVGYSQENSHFGQLTHNPLFQNVLSTSAFSPRQASLRPLQSLDDRVMRQFKVLEQKDPRFKKLKQMQSDSSPRQAEYNV